MYKVGDHKTPPGGWNDAGDASLVGPESRRGLPSSWPGTEVGDLFFPLCHEGALLACSLLGESYVVGVLRSAAVDGGDESVGGGPDRRFEVLVIAEEVLCRFRG